MDTRIRLERHGSCLLVTPWVSSLADECTCVVLKRARDEKRPWENRLIPQRVPLYTVAAGGKHGLVYGGLSERAETFLRQQNLDVVAVDVRKPLPQVGIDFPDVEYREGQREALLAITQHHEGVLQCPPAWGKTFLIEMLCRIYEQSRILIITTKSSVLKDIHRRVSNRLSEEAKVVRCDKDLRQFDTLTRVCVCSTMSLHKIPTDWPDIVLFDEVHGAAADGVSTALLAFTSARRYGFSATPRGRSDKADLIVEALFGPVIHRVNYQDAVRTGSVSRIQVWMVDVEGPVPKGTDTTTLNRHGIWRNTVRNDMVRKTVRALFKIGIQKVLIMTTTVEHAAILKLYLPEFRIVCNKPDPDRLAQLTKKGFLPDPTVLDEDEEKLRADFKNGQVTGIICTQRWREGYTHSPSWQ